MLPRVKKRGRAFLRTASDGLRVCALSVLSISEILVRGRGKHSMF